MALIHATCVAVHGMAVLLVGPSGSGKSDLALRLIDGGGLLVADDQVQITAQDDVLLATPPPTVAGLIEVRGVGLMRVAHAGRSPVGVAFELDARPPERLPVGDTLTLEGHKIPLFRLDPFQASAAARVRVTVAGLRHGAMAAGSGAPR